MKEQNKAITSIRELHRFQTLDEIVNGQNSAKIFRKLDLTTGYHQLELDKDSKYIITFSTYFGTYQYERLNFDIWSASKVLQKAICSVIQHIYGSLKYQTTEL